MTRQGKLHAAAAPPVLVVDLDDTLIATDLLFETFWTALAAAPRAVLPAAARFLAGGGMAPFKAAMARLAPPDPATLPYDPEVLALIETHRAAGGRTALCTASDRRLAETVAAHLGLFDEVHGSDGSTNLKGPAKAAFLVERYGRGGYDYVGDAAADLPVWEGARTAITVGASDSVRAAARSASGEVRHLDGHRTTPVSVLAASLRTMRPHQWLKNVLVFLPVLTAHAARPDIWLSATLGFVAFSLVASGVYVLNDLLDLAADRGHPRKRGRPLASGALPLAWGTALAPGLFAAGTLFALATGSLRFLGVLLVYVALTTAYSLVLKRRLVIDICTLAGLYSLRIVAGGLAAGVVLSFWLLAFSIFFFFALAAVKRQGELVDGIARGIEQSSGRAYQAEDLPIVAMMALASGYVSVLVLALYITSDTVQRLYAAPEMLWTICPVLLYWISRVVMVAHRGTMHDDPIVFALRDRTSHACGLIIAAAAIAATLA